MRPDLIILTLMGELPLIAACVAGFVLCLSFRRQVPRASLFALAGVALLLVWRLAGPLLFAFLTRSLDQEDVQRTAVWVWQPVGSGVVATALGLLLAAIFARRDDPGPSPPTTAGRTAPRVGAILGAILLHPVLFLLAYGYGYHYGGSGVGSPTGSPTYHGPRGGHTACQTLFVLYTYGSFGLFPVAVSAVGTLVGYRIGKLVGGNPFGSPGNGNDPPAR